jgi:hypothetical protein
MPAELEPRTEDLLVTAPAVGVWLHDSEATRTPRREVLSSPLPVEISREAIQAGDEEAWSLGTAPHRVLPPVPRQVTAKTAGTLAPLAPSRQPILLRAGWTPLTPSIQAAPATTELIPESNGSLSPIAAPPLERALAGLSSPVLPAMAIPEPAGLIRVGMPEAVPAHSVIAGEGRPAWFTEPALRKPVLGAAPDRLALRPEEAIREEILGADVADAPAGIPVGPSLGSLSVLPALASLFRYGRPARSVAPLPHVKEGLSLSPRNRLAAAAAYMELPLPVQRPLVPRSSGLRIVETFEYQKPLGEPPSDLWQSLVRFWRAAPVYLRLAAVSACLILLFWVYVPGGGASHILASRWNEIQAGVRDRAAVELSEDFQGDMDEWQGEGDWTRSWQKSKAGFVRPGRLALYQPSMQMQEYQVEFLMQVEKTAVGWAYRATDPENYYATKITIVKPGPLPALSLVRYPVIGGRAGPRVEVPIRVLMHNNTPYRVQLTVSGNGFSTSIEGQLVDFWRDDSLKVGGFGFFSDTGESARVYWMKLSHQNDFIGRVCAYFRPAAVQVRSSN